MTDLASIELWGKERQWQSEGRVPSNSIHLRLLLVQLTRMLPTFPLWSLNMLLKFEPFPVPLHKPRSGAQQLPNVNLDLLVPFSIHAFMSCQPFHHQMQSFRCKSAHFHLFLSPATFTAAYASPGPNMKIINYSIFTLTSSGLASIIDTNSTSKAPKWECHLPQAPAGFKYYLSPEAWIHQTHSQTTVNHEEANATTAYSLTRCPIL